MTSIQPEEGRRLTVDKERCAVCGHMKDYHDRPMGACGLCSAANDFHMFEFKRQPEEGRTGAALDDLDRVRQLAVEYTDRVYDGMTRLQEREDMARLDWMNGYFAGRREGRREAALRADGGLAPVAPPKIERERHRAFNYVGSRWPHAARDERERLAAAYLAGRKSARGATAPVAVVLGDSDEIEAARKELSIAIGGYYLLGLDTGVLGLSNPSQGPIERWQARIHAALDAFQRAIEQQQTSLLQHYQDLAVERAAETAAAEAERDRLRDAAKRLAMEVHLTTGSPDAVWDAHEAVLDLLDEPAALEGQGNPQ